MTWIVGASSLFGYGVMLSDTQVTLTDKKTTIDFIQKAYPLSNFIVGGFAGSVAIGFALLQSLSDFLRFPPGHEHKAWDPIKVANGWSPIAKQVFHSFPPAERRLESRFLMVAASPYPAKGKWPPGWDSQIYLIRFVSRDFKPQIMSKRVGFCSIGSGASVEQFQRSLRNRIKLGIFDSTLKAEVGNVGGWGQNLAFGITRLIERHPQPGISKHLHVLLVKRGLIWGGNNNEDIYPPEGDVIQFRMPQVAKNYQEFTSLLNEQGFSEAGATC